MILLYQWRHIDKIWGSTAPAPPKLGSSRWSCCPFSDALVSGVPRDQSWGRSYDLPSWLQNSMKMFADDTKVWQKIAKDNDNSLLQADLQSLEAWFKYWQLKFNPEKCKVMHIGHKFKTFYKMSDNGIDKQLQEVREEKDLRVFVTSDLKPSMQCITTANKAQSVLRMIKRNFPKIDKESCNILYKTYVRPYLEYCVQAWSPGNGQGYRDSREGPAKGNQMGQASEEQMSCWQTENFESYNFGEEKKKRGPDWNVQDNHWQRRYRLI